MSAMLNCFKVPSGGVASDPCRVVVFSPFFSRHTSPSRPSTCVPILATAPRSPPRATAWSGRQLRPLPAGQAKNGTGRSREDAPAPRSLRSEAARLGVLVFAPSEFVPGGFRFPEPRGGSARVGLTDRFHTTHCRVVTSKPLRCPD